MHLVIVSPFPPDITGIGQYGYYITRALASSGAFSRVTVLAGSQTVGEHPNHLGSTEIDYCWQPGKLKARTVILSRVKRLNPDLVWFNLGASVFGKSPWVNFAGMFAPMITQRMGYPTVVTLHELPEFSNLRVLNAPGGLFAPWAARWLTSVATQADIVCLTRDQYVNHLAKRMVDCIHIPHGAFANPALLAENGNAELLMFNMLAPFKGVDILLKAFSLLKAEYPSLQLTIAGEEHHRFPGYVQAIKRRFAGIQGVNWLGKVETEDVIELFRRAQIVILPYRASTGSSSILYQAASWGRAVVLSDLDEMRALVREADFQVDFFKNESVESLQNTIRALLASPEKRHAQIHHNFKAIQNARIEITCQRYLRTFNRALEKRRSPKQIDIKEIEPA